MALGILKRIKQNHKSLFVQECGILLSLKPGNTELNILLPSTLACEQDLRRDFPSNFFSSSSHTYPTHYFFFKKKKKKIKHFPCRPKKRELSHASTFLTREAGDDNKSEISTLALVTHKKGGWGRRGRGKDCVYPTNIANVNIE